MKMQYISWKSPKRLAGVVAAMLRGEGSGVGGLDLKAKRREFS
jgi:hypothetical protein